MAATGTPSIHEVRVKDPDQALVLAFAPVVDISAYPCTSLGGRDRVGTAWRLSLEDDQRVVVVLTADGWFLAG